MDALDVTGLVVLGFVAGAAGGLLGVGGGIVFVPALVVFAHLSQLHALATSLAIVLVAIVGAARQREYGNVRLRDGLVIGLLAPLGVLAGVALATPCRSGRSSSRFPACSSPSPGNSRETRACARFPATWRSSR